VLKGEDIIFDAGESGIFVNGNLSDNTGITYSWACSGAIATLCTDNVSTRLNLNWDDIEAKGLAGAGEAVIYEIELTAKWTPEGEATIYNTETMQVQWLNVSRLRGMRIAQAPMSTFNLSKNHIYSLYIQNMEYGTLDHYNIAWTLVDRNNKVVGTL
jgi:hypothetical protein